MTKARASGCEISKAWKSFWRIIDPLRVAGDKKEGISTNSGLSRFGD